MSSASNGKHSEPVWQVYFFNFWKLFFYHLSNKIHCRQVYWAPDNLDGYQNFYSCSSDGRVTNWTIVKNALWHCDQLCIDFDRPLQNIELDGGVKLLDGARALSFKPDKLDLFLVGTEEGDIHLATIEYDSQFLSSYHGHTTPVNCIAWNPFFPEIFISCASESLVIVWHKELSTPILRYNLSNIANLTQPILRYNLGNMVGQVAWAPYSSTVFAAVTDSKIVVFDLFVHKYRPICQQKIVANTTGVLNCISFNKIEPVVIVGDSTGMVHSLKLSPNLRKKSEKGKDGGKDGDDKGFAEDDKKVALMLEVTKLKKILSQVIQRGATGEDSGEEEL